MSIVKIHFNNRLALLGYPIDDIQYSLNYCQGDGVAFYGELDDSSLLSAADRLLNGKHKAAAKRSIDKGWTLSIGRNAFGAYYSHFNTMSFEWLDGDEATDLEEQSFELLVGRIEEEARALSRELEREGYAILEAGSSCFTLDNNKQTICTRRFEISIEETECDDFEVDHWDESNSESFITEIIEGRTRYFDLKVTVTHKGSGIPLGCAYLANCTYPMQQKLKAGDYREVALEAISEARKQINSMALAA